jgi:hypothetical protein
MHRFLVALIGLALVTAGCRNQNPYAMFGPATVPPPNLPAPPPGGYYPPPAVPPGSPAATVPGGAVFPGSTPPPAADFRPSLGSTPATSLPTATLLPVPPKTGGELSASTLTATAPTTTSLASSNSFTAEEPIRIVEAAPSANSAANVATVLPFRQPAPPTVVQANPAVRTSPSPIPAVPFNASGSAADVSSLPRPGIHAPATSVPAIPAVPLNKTRGFLPASPSGAGSFRTDSSVKPAGYVEAVPSAAAGQWRAR